MTGQHRPENQQNSNSKRDSATTPVNFQHFASPSAPPPLQLYAQQLNPRYAPLDAPRLYPITNGDIKIIQESRAGLPVKAPELRDTLTFEERLRGRRNLRAPLSHKTPHLLGRSP